jgi:stage V sporulation protein G
MRITEVRITAADRDGPSGDGRLLAFASVCLGGAFAVHDIRVIQARGGRFTAMPSRKVSARCPCCGGKNHLRAHFCNDCGEPIPPVVVEVDGRGREKLHVDLCHPITVAARLAIEAAVLAAYDAGAVADPLDPPAPLAGRVRAAS